MGGYIDIDKLIPMIDRVALECMMTPIQEGKNSEGKLMTLAEIANYNSLIALNNEGVRDLAKALKYELQKEDE